MAQTALVPYMLEFKPYQYKDGNLGLEWDKPINKSTSIGLFDSSIRNARGMSKTAIDLVLANMPSAKQYLETYKDDFLWSGQVLAHGKEYRADPQEPWHLRKPWACFENAYRLAKESGGRIHYAEGLALSPMGGMLHGWGVCDGKVLDYTWPVPHINRYFGVVFDLEFLDDIGLHGAVFGRWDPVKEYLATRRPA